MFGKVKEEYMKLKRDFQDVFVIIGDESVKRVFKIFVILLNE